MARSLVAELARAQRVPAPLVAVSVLVGTTTYLLAVHAGVGPLVR